MRYYSFNDMDDDGDNIVITVSEEDVRHDYYPYWQKRMTEVGKDLSQYTFEDCLDDWIVVNWAWEVNDEGTSN